jgi:large subunit ribosomal protein L54
LPHFLSTLIANTANTYIMICRQCLQRLGRRAPASTLQQSSRFFSQTSSTRAEAVTLQTTQATNPRPNDKPAATSTSAAQPFSTPLTPNPKAGKSDVATKPAAPKVQSSVAAGTVLKGLNFMKNKQDPVAMEDHEYPAWLWEVLAEKKDAASSKGADAEGDLFCKFYLRE